MITLKNTLLIDRPFFELIQLLRPDTDIYEPIPEGDWDQIIAIAERMRVISLLFFIIKQKPVISPPPQAYEHIRSGYLSNASQSLHLTHELIRILTSLDQNAIPAIPLKGSYLAHEVYEHPPLRQMGDLDIMVRWEDISRATVSLKNLGYITMNTYHLDDITRRYDHHIPCFTHPSGIHVELHWNITGAHHVGHKEKAIEDQLWDRAKPGQFLRTNAYLLAPEDLILHSAIHLAIHHGFHFGIRELYDINRIFRRFHGCINWEYLFSSAKEMKLKRLLILTLVLTDIITGSHISDELKAKGFPVEIPEQQLMNALEEIVREGMPIRSSIPLPLTNPSPLALFHTIVDWVFLSRERMEEKFQVPSGSFRVYLWYPYHLVDLIIRQAPDLFREVWSFHVGGKREGLSEWLHEE